MSGRLMWGTANDAARMVDPDLLRRAGDGDYAMIEREDQIGGPSSDNQGSLDRPMVPATRLIYLVEDEGDARVVAVTGEAIAGNQDVLAAVEDDIAASTQRLDIRPDAAAEPIGSEQPTTLGTAGRGAERPTGVPR